MTDKTENHAEQQARAQVASIVEMVRALKCDYERLEELREARDDWAQSMVDCVPGLLPKEDAYPKWARENPEDAEELAALEEQAGECESTDDARQRIEEDALSVEVRSDWCSPGETMEAGEFRIVLCTGGPHVEIVGELDRGEPSRVRVLYRDWGESGELFDFDRDAVLTYARCFYFGE